MIIKINKKLYKIVFFALSIFVLLGLVNVKAGYTYDSNKEPIYSTDGFTVNELPYSYNSLGIDTGGVNARPTDLFVYNITDPITKELIPQNIYLTDAALNAFFVFDTELNLQQSISTVRLVPDDLFATNITKVSSCVYDDQGNSRSEILFATESLLPTQAELDDPNGKYGGKGYVELKFKEPSCTYRAQIPGTGQEFIYVCDTGNRQIVVLDYNSYDPNSQTYAVHQVITKTDELDDDVAFEPKKLITDVKGRLYVIVNNVLDGIMQFSIEGEFQRYTGTNTITLSAWDIFWRNFSSEAVLSKKSKLYNTSFNSLVYFESMIYTTSNAVNMNGTLNDKIMIKRINPSGDDTLARNGYNVPMGDVKYSTSNVAEKDATGASQLVSITVNSYGVYSVVDQLRGRIFTYDNEGNLLYISGGNNGTQADKLNKPVSIQYLGENLLVLDSGNKTIVRFEPTEIATLINCAVKQEKVARRIRTTPHFNHESKSWWIGEVDTQIANEKALVEEKEGYWYIDGKNTNIEAEELAASDYWAKVIKLNANYEYAYVGIGHKFLEEKNYKEAMKYFELGKNKVYYSKAFKQYRDGIIKQWFAPVVVTLFILIVARVIFKAVRNKKLGIRKEEETGVGDE